MTLFEAIRELKEGQEIITANHRPLKLVTFYHDGELLYPCREYHLGQDVRIVDLPKPKMTLEAGLEKAAFECLIGKRFDISEPTGYLWTANGIGYPTWSRAVAAGFASALRSLPIDWQAEADRKEEK